MSDQVKYLLEESEMPTAWYNVQADFATPLPPVIHPGTGKPIGPEDLAPLVRVALQVEEGQRAAVEGLAPGAPVRFDGQILGANPLLFTLQVVSATVSASR